jgi:hypothetical protein
VEKLLIVKAEKMSIKVQYGQPLKQQPEEANQSAWYSFAEALMLSEHCVCVPQSA